LSSNHGTRSCSLPRRRTRVLIWLCCGAQLGRGCVCVQGCTTFCCSEGGVLRSGKTRHKRERERRLSCLNLEPQGSFDDSPRSLPLGLIRRVERGSLYIPTEDCVYVCRGVRPFVVRKGGFLDPGKLDTRERERGLRTAGLFRRFAAILATRIDSEGRARVAIHSRC
jgi:hypothetical protein